MSKARKSRVHTYLWGNTESHFNLFGSSSTDAHGASQAIDSFTGNDLPGWKNLIRQGRDATTSAFGEKFSIEGNTLYKLSQRGYDIIGAGHYDRGEDYYGLLPVSYPDSSIPYASPGLKADVRNRAIRKFLDQAKAARSSFEAGQDLGEIKQTIESFHHPMNSLKNLTIGYLDKLKKVRSKYSRSKVSLRKALSDSYLEYRFGWRPLAFDIADAYEGLRNRTRMSDTVPLSASATGSEPYFSGTFGLQNASRLTCTRSVYNTYQYRLKGAIRLTLDHGRIPVMQALQLSTLNDFAVTAWDLLPYSWVVDYFANIGDIINAVTFPSSLFTYVCETTRSTTTCSYSVSYLPYFDRVDQVSLFVDFSSGNPKFLRRSFTRNHVPPESLVPTFRVNLPVSSRPWENIGALISSRIKSLVPFYR